MPGIERWKAGVAAGTDDHIRPEIPDDLFATAHRAEHAPGSSDVLLQSCQTFPPAQPGTGQADQLIAGLGHQLLLHMPFGADKEDFAVRVPFFQDIGHGDGRIDMPAGSATGKNHIHKVASCFLISFR